MLRGKVTSGGIRGFVTSLVDAVNAPR